MSYGETLQPRSSIGEPEPDISHLLKWFDELVIRDEPLLALELLKLLPSRLRDNIPSEIKLKRDKLLSKLVTPSDCVGENFVPPIESITGDEILDCLRGRLVLESAIKCNKLGFTAKIVEYAPGNYFLPVGLRKQRVEFAYHPIFIDWIQYNVFNWRYFLPASATHMAREIFVAHEIIEHLWNPLELVKEQLKHAPNAEVIHLSTPEYNYFHNRDWENGPPLLHMRAYTPKEFIQFAETNWPDFFWQMYPGQPMSLVGIRHGFETRWM